MRKQCPVCRQSGLSLFSLAFSTRAGAARCRGCRRGFFVRHSWRLAALALMLGPLFIALKLHLAKLLLLDALLIMTGYFMATRMVGRWARLIGVDDPDAARIDHHGKWWSAAVAVAALASLALVLHRD